MPHIAITWRHEGICRIVRQKCVESVALLHMRTTFWELTSPWVGYLVAAENKFIKQAKLQ
jgi:hypothetical protein